MAVDYAMKLIIDGDEKEPESGYFSVINPATGDSFAEAPSASIEQLDEAVSSAATAFKSWSKTPDEERKALLFKVADAIEANAAELATIITQEQGKPMPLAQFEVGGAVGWTRYTASLDIPVETLEDSEVQRIEMHRKPLGVVASILPWNWPLLIAIWHIIPALRAGNTVVVKPSPYTPFNALKLVEIMNQVLPKGVINIVSDEDKLGPAISAHSKINKIIFTGSTLTGQHIMRSAAVNLKRLTLELGGNDAAIVLPDADVDTIAQGIFETAFINMGQTCAAIKRLYVHESIYDALADKLIEIANQQTLGNGFDEGVSFGPVQNKAQYEIVNNLINEAKADGATVHAAAVPTSLGEGYFIAPTIVTDAKNGMSIVDKEQFGPVLPLIRYTDIDNAVSQANNSQNGLGGSVWGTDVELAQSLGAQLECGTVWVNNHAMPQPHAPFGGCKMSGFGVEFGLDGLLEYTSAQVMHIKK